MPQRHQPYAKYSNKARKRHYKDADQIAEDLADPEKKTRLETAQPVDNDLPGDGQFYCVECSRYFACVMTLERHRRGKRESSEAIIHLFPTTHRSDFSPQAASEAIAEGASLHPG